MTYFVALFMTLSAQAQDSRFVRGAKQCLRHVPGVLATDGGIAFCSSPNLVTVVQENASGLVRTQDFVLDRAATQAKSLRLAWPPNEGLSLSASFDQSGCELKSAPKGGEAVKISSHGDQVVAKSVERLALKMKAQLLAKSRPEELASADTRAWFRGCLFNLSYVVRRFGLGDAVLTQAEESELRELVTPSNPGPKPAKPAHAVRD